MAGWERQYFLSAPQKGFMHMATYKLRGSTHNVIYQYRTSAGKVKQQWESYDSKLEAMQRKAYIDYLQANKMTEEIRKLALEYKQARAIEKTASKLAHTAPDSVTEMMGDPEENLTRTYREFMERFLPLYARKKNFSPKTYDSYICNLNAHILPYFGDWIMSAITAQAIDDFIDHLRKKPCRGYKSYGKKASDIPMLSSPTIKKCYNILMVGFPTAKRWGYVKEIPASTAPSEKYKKRKAWSSVTVMEILNGMRDDPLLHLSVHLAFVCSLRAGEVAGIDANSVDPKDHSIWITQILERVSDESLQQLPKERIVRIFPKQNSLGKSSLILKAPKTEDSFRKQYLTDPLLDEIMTRLKEIEQNKALLGPDYHDYGLLICQPDGRPLDPNNLCKSFRKWQASRNISDQIDFQGLRKSGQMHKVRLTKNNYQLVAENSGQSPSVLMSNYNEALDSEKRELSQLVEDDLYPKSKPAPGYVSSDEAIGRQLLEKIESDPEFSKQLLQLLLRNAGSIG